MFYMDIIVYLHIIGMQNRFKRTFFNKAQQ